jgi:tetratricopeptide (TPR) repeat protein
MEELAAGTGLSAGRFRLQRLLGRGGSAEVWAATDLASDTEVALRVVAATDAASAGSLLATLRGDVERLRGLVHPGILRPLDVVAAGNRVIVVLELADRGDLTSLRGAGYQAIVTAIRDVADALQYVHARGLTHGDLKAGNVLRDAQGRWRLTDFRGGDLPEAHRAVSLSTVSPQQLDGAPPTVADDIYSLGALLYDLLAGAPPLHPAITPARIRSEVPARIGVDGEGQAVPVALTQLVAAMLEKSPQLRPGSLGTVRALLAEIATGAGRTPLPPVPAAATGPVHTPRARQPGGAGPRLLVAAGLVALLAGILAVVFWLPGVVSERGPLVAPRPAVPPAPPVTATAQAPDARARADAALAQRLRAGDAARGAAADRWGGADWLEARRLADLGDEQYKRRDFEAAAASFTQAAAGFTRLAEGAPAALAAALAAGQAAYSRPDQPAAVAAFERALQISPDDATAKQGLARSQQLDQVLAAMASATALEAAGDSTAARAGYASVLGLEPDWAPARAAIARLDAARAAGEFERSMAQGLAALAAGRTAEARTALRRALVLRPDDAGARGALDQLDGDVRRNQLAGLQAEAEQYAVAERWTEAAAKYRAMLAIDPAVAAAKTGLATADSRADLHERIVAQLGNGDRFNDDTVVAGAQAVIRDAEAVAAPGPVLGGQLARLKALITAAARPVAVQFESDNLTSVQIYKVGTLGAFTSRTVELRPGSYVVVGSRDGYRDVRQTVRIPAAGGQEPIRVRCEEQI